MRAFVILCLMMVASADRQARIRNYQYGIEEDGAYESTFTTTNGIRADADGISYPGETPGTGNYVMTGSYSYTWQGVTYTVNWVADENGFHPSGDHLPDFSYTREHIGDVSEEEGRL